jgi:hypothetical protein
MSVANAINQHEMPIAASTNDVATPAANQAATITYAAGAAGVSHCISGLMWSYSAAPTGGNLQVQDGSGNVVFSMDITAAGAGFIPFSPPKKGTTATAMIITLAAGGNGVSGKVSVAAHWTEGPGP